MAGVNGSDPGRVFISYRRTDTAPYARLLSYELRDRILGVHVFMDVDSIEPGQHFVRVIQEAVNACEVMLVLIGRGWLGATDADGRRRLDDPNDPVRVEVQTALGRGIRVIPLLVDGAAMPREAQLPEPLADLAWRNALELTHTHYPFDANRLLRTVQGVLAAAARPSDPKIPQPPRRVAATPLDETRFLSSLQDQPYRNALSSLFKATKSAGLVVAWGTVGASIRIDTRDRAEPLTVAWVFPDRGGWSGLRNLTLGFDRGSAAQTPSIKAMLDEYVTSVAQVSGATAVRAKVLLAYTFAPDVVVEQHARLAELLVAFARRVQEAS